MNELTIEEFDALSPDTYVLYDIRSMDEINHGAIKGAIASSAENADRGQGLGGELFGCSRDGLGGICIVGGKRGRRQRGDEQEQDEQERNAFFHIQSSLSGSPENRPSYYRMEWAGLQTLFGWKIAVEFFSCFV